MPKERRSNGFVFVKRRFQRCIQLEPSQIINLGYAPELGHEHFRWQFALLYAIHHCSRDSLAQDHGSSISQFVPAVVQQSHETFPKSGSDTVIHHIWEHPRRRSQVR